VTLPLTLPVFLALLVLLVAYGVGCYVLGFHEGRLQGRSEDEEGNWRW
jgi:hypothetical protein